MRNIWLDNTKFFLMFLVVLGHVALLVNNNVSHSIYLFIYAFHMPLFFMIAGLFS